MLGLWLRWLLLRRWWLGLLLLKIWCLVLEILLIKTGKGSLTWLLILLVEIFKMSLGLRRSSLLWRSLIKAGKSSLCLVLLGTLLVEVGEAFLLLLGCVTLL